MGNYTAPASSAISGLVTTPNFVFNEDSADKDLRVESDDETHMLFVDGGSNRISIGDSTDTPAATLELTNHATAGAFGVPLLQLNSNDVDKIAVDLNAANTTANVFDITANALTSGAILNISATGLTSGSALNLVTSSAPANGTSSAVSSFTMANTSVNSQTVTGLLFTLNKTGSTAASKASIMTGIHVDLDDNANHASSTATMTGMDIDVTSASTAGTNKNIGLDVAVSGATTNYAALFSGGNVGIGTSTPVGDLHVISASTDNNVIIETTADPGSGGAPDLILYQNPSGNIQDDDTLGHIRFRSKNDASEDVMYADIYATARDVRDNQEDGDLNIRTVVAGTETSRLYMGDTETVVNDNSKDLDFRVESDGNPNMIYVDAGNNLVGIGKVPVAVLDVAGDIRFRSPVESIATNPSPGVVESGTVFYMSNSGTIAFTLPSEPLVGTQFVVVNKLGNDINITPDGSSKINGGSNGAVVTNTTAWAATTVVCVAANQWAAFGGI